MSEGIEDWLPELITHDGGEWEPYLESVYLRFRQDFVPCRSTCLGRRIGINRRLVNSKEWTFWHLVQEGRVEDDRVPDFRRCERIAWPLAIMGAAGTERVVYWEKQVTGDPRLLIALPDFSYVVVAGTRNAGYCHLITAYCVTGERRRGKLRREASIAPKG